MTDLPILNCDNCGACCMEMRSPPFIGDMDPEFMALPGEMRVAIVTHALGDAPPESPCLWLDLETRRCKHYDLRPEICRDFEVGSDGCRRWREAYGIDQSN